MYLSRERGKEDVALLLINSMDRELHDTSESVLKSNVGKCNIQLGVVGFCECV